MNTIRYIIGSLSCVVFFVAVFLSPLIRRRVDVDILKTRGDLDKLMTTSFLPRDVLTPAGQKMWVWRNILFGIAFVLFSILVVWGQIDPK